MAEKTHKSQNSEDIEIEIRSSTKLKDMESHSAEGVVGFVLRGMSGHFFRVYNEDNKSHTDYTITNCDLKVKIIDAHAMLYKGGDGNHDGYLDYDFQTLGIHL